MRHLLLSLSLLLFFCGCTKLQLLPYLDQALVLQDFGQEKAAQHKFIENIDAKYEKLSDALQSGTIANYKTELKVLKEFGPPLLERGVMLDGKLVKSSVYRKAMWRLAKTKIYLYYDNQGQLIKWEQQSASF